MSHAEAVPSAEESTLEELIERFPLPVALVGGGGNVSHKNALFQDAVGSLETNPVFGPLISAPDGAWHSIRLVQRDGRLHASRAQAVRFRQSVLLVVVDSGEDKESASLEMLRARIEDLERSSATDPLTGAWNRRHLDAIIENEVSRSLRSRQPVSLVLIDVDRFKSVNDELGHLAGDAILCQTVAVLREAIRGADLLFRWGGDEFVVLAVSSGRRSAAVLAEKLRARVAGHDFGDAGPVTVSVGVAEHAAGDSTTEWFARVDAALYAAKVAGRNRLVVDPRGSSDLWAQEDGHAALRLEWSEAYESGESTIDAQHRELFVLVNELLAAALPRDDKAQSLPFVLDKLVAHVERHFADEEQLLSRHGYAHLEGHREIHEALLARAEILRAGVSAGTVRPGELVEFLAGDVVSRHILKTDCAFFHLFSGSSPTPSG